MANKRLKTHPLEIIEQVYERGSPAYRILVAHGTLVAQKSVLIAERVAHLNPDIRFLKEAALLHDIGMIFTRSPKLGCHGQHPYVCHGVFGRRLLEEIGLPQHALVCERHVGVGITREDIRSQQLPLPDRDMLPQSIEEQIICYADKFYSKNGKSAGEEKPVQKILKKLRKYGSAKVQRFQSWADLFENR
jgi:uncharacterized protein